MAKKKTEIPKPVLARHCANCGEWFIARHPKDNEKYCEKCREEVKREK